MAIDWLENLEEKVKLAAAELQELRRDNAQLKRRLRALELQAAESPDDDWRSERQEIQRRVESLVEGLEGLLGL